MRSVVLSRIYATGAVGCSELRALTMMRAEKPHWKEAPMRLEPQVLLVQNSTGSRPEREACGHDEGP